MNLFQKYNIAVPRYTSYPTVPYWDKTPTEKEWKSSFQKTFSSTNSEDGISLYIHLPYCESLCTYCACNTRITKNHLVEKPYIKAVTDEWKLYLAALDEKPILKEVHLGGGTPTFFSPQNLWAMLEEIFSHCIIPEDHDFSFEAHPANTTIKHLEMLRALGFRRLSLGIQDFDPKVQKAIHRHQTFEEVKEITEKARAMGYNSINYDLIFGLPFQTIESVQNTILQVCALKPDRIAFYSYAHVPWLKPGQRGYEDSDLPEGEEKRKLYEAGKEIFLYNGYTDIGLDHFALPNDDLLIAWKEKRLHRNFMGYTTRHTKLLIGLGASSISDSEGAFVQNVKKVEDYLKLVHEGKFPFEKGHLLNDADLRMRKTISNIMCRQKTDFELVNDEEMQVITERLKPLEEDELIEINAGGLIVSEKGKAFIRNISLCFDERYWQNVKTKEVFSKGV